MAHAGIDWGVFMFRVLQSVSEWAVVRSVPLKILVLGAEYAGRNYQGKGFD